MSKIIGPKEDDISGVSAHGELVNIDPTSARQTFFAPSGAADSALENSLSAHPLELSRRSLSGELVLPPPEPTYVSRNVKKLGVRISQFNRECTRCVRHRQSHRHSGDSSSERVRKHC